LAPPPSQPPSAARSVSFPEGNFHYLAVASPVAALGGGLTKILFFGVGEEMVTAQAIGVSSRGKYIRLIELLMCRLHSRPCFKSVSLLSLSSFSGTQMASCFTWFHRKGEKGRPWHYLIYAIMNFWWNFYLRRLVDITALATRRRVDKILGLGRNIYEGSTKVSRDFGSSALFGADKAEFGACRSALAPAPPSSHSTGVADAALRPRSS